jgi:predicted DNA binding protein
MSVGFTGWRTEFKVETKENWLSKAATRFNTVIISTPFPSKNPKADYDLRVLFPGVQSEKTVRKFVEETVKHARLSAVIKSEAGVLALLECKGRNTLEFRVTSLLERVALIARPEDMDIAISIDSPLGIDLDDLVKKTDVPGVRLVEGPSSERRRVPLEELVEIHMDEFFKPEQLDETDFKIAKLMLESGYFKVPRPKGFSLSMLSEKASVTKPSLIWRMRRLQALGIERLLGSEDIPEEDLSVAADIFVKRLLKK